MLQTARDANTPYPSDPINLSKYIRLARITKVYDIDEAYPTNLSEYGNVEIMWLDAVDPYNNKETIPCLTPGASWSRGSGIYRMPHINDVAAVFQLPNTRPIIIGYLPKYLTQAITADSDSPAEVVGKLPALRSGEILLKSSGQNEIIISNNDVIKFITRDASQHSIVSTEDIPETTEFEFARVLNNDNNITAELTLGLSGDTLGAGDVVAALEIPTFYQKICEFSIEKNAQASFTLPTSYTGVAYKISSAVFVPSQGNQTSSVIHNKTLNINDFTIDTLRSYTKSDGTDTGDVNSNELSFDGTIYTSIVTIQNTKTSSLLKAGGKLVLSVVYREVLGSIKVNNLADCEINMRNIVFKNKKNVMLGLFDDGTLRTNAAETEIGNTLTGHMRLNPAGVSINAGLSTGAVVKINTDEESIKNHLYTDGPVKQNEVATDTKKSSAGRHYFAISDSLPLFYYDTDNKCFGITLQEEYDKLTVETRIHIPYRNFDDSDSGLFTVGRVQELLKTYNSNKSLFKPYGELRKP